VTSHTPATGLTASSPHRREDPSLRGVKNARHFGLRPKPSRLRKTTNQKIMQIGVMAAGPSESRSKTFATKVHDGTRGRTESQQRNRRAGGPIFIRRGGENTHRTGEDKKRRSQRKQKERNCGTRPIRGRDQHRTGRETSSNRKKG